MRDGSVLILTAGFGEGHNAAARNLAAALRELRPGIKVAVHDVFAESVPLINRIARFGYHFAITRTPSLWALTYHLLDRIPATSTGVKLLGAPARHLRHLLRKHAPDVLVSVFPGYGPIIDKIAPAAKRNFAYATVITDSLTVNAIWLRCSSDTFLTPNEPTARVLEDRGVPHEKIRVTGFPVPLLFSTPPPRREVPPSDGCWCVLYMVNGNPAEVIETTRALLSLDNVSLTVACGKNERLRTKLDALAKELGRRIELHGWTPDMPQLIRSHHILIGKAGGATIQEALAAHTPMIITQIVPGQEEGNARLLIENSAGDFATTPQAIADAVASLTEPSCTRYKERLLATTRLGHPNGAKDTAHFIISLL
jgi:processive 1,2-diacylglycerol beta-glucosyltransferase